MGYKTAGGSTDYSYDNNGNLTADVNKQITSINYNYLNLPSLVTGAKGNITYYYDAVGIKLEKIVYDNATNSTTSTYYAGGIVYQSTSSAPTIALQFIAQEEGRIRQTSNGSTTYFAYDYFLKDHLGNVRMTITDDYAMSDPIVDVTHYYPFGLAMAGISAKAAGSLENKYKYNKGSELQHLEFSNGSGIELYATDFRSYDPQLGRFHQIDPLAESIVRNSVYIYCNDNPVKFIDPTGLQGENTNNSDDELVHVLYLKNTATGEITASQVDDETFNANTNGGQDLMADIHFGDGNFVYQNDNGRGQFQTKEFHGENTDVVEGSYHYVGHINWSKTSLLDNDLDKSNKGVGSFGVGWGVKQELFDFAVRDRAGISRTAFNNLSNQSREALEITALGTSGTKYLKAVKGIGLIGAAVSISISSYKAINYYAHGGKGYTVGAKAGLDIIMTGVGFLGPIGFGISAAYFIIDAATDGFGTNKNEWDIKQ